MGGGNPAHTQLGKMQQSNNNNNNNIFIKQKRDKVKINI